MRFIPGSNNNVPSIFKVNNAFPQENIESWKPILFASLIEQDSVICWSLSVAQEYSSSSGAYWIYKLIVSGEMNVGGLYVF